MLLRLWLLPFQLLTLIVELLHKGIDRTFVSSDLPVRNRGVWKKAPDLPSFRYECGGAAVAHDIFVVGGIFAPTLYTVTRRAEIYNIRTKKWKRVADLPYMVHHPGTVSDGKHVYVIGGNGIRIFSRRDCIRYNKKNNVWEKLSKMPTKRCALGLSYYDGKIYAVGGADNKKPLSTFESYDIKTGVWRTLPNMPTPREHMYSVAHSGKVYALGGYQSDRMHTLDIFEVYDTATSTWSSLPSIPIKVCGFSAATWKDSIFIFGGEQGWSITDEVYEYKIKEKKWFRCPNLSSARYASICATAPDGIHVIGGNKRMMTEQLSQEHDIYIPK